MEAGFFWDLGPGESKGRVLGKSLRRNSGERRAGVFGKELVLRELESVFCEFAFGMVVVKILFSALTGIII